MEAAGPAAMGGGPFALSPPACPPRSYRPRGGEVSGGDVSVRWRVGKVRIDSAMSGDNSTVSGCEEGGGGEEEEAEEGGRKRRRRRWRWGVFRMVGSPEWGWCQ